MCLGYNEILCILRYMFMISIICIVCLITTCMLTCVCTCAAGLCNTGICIRGSIGSTSNRLTEWGTCQKHGILVKTRIKIKLSIMCSAIVHARTKFCIIIDSAKVRLRRVTLKLNAMPIINSSDSDSDSIILKFIF